MSIHAFTSLGDQNTSEAAPRRVAIDHELRRHCDCGSIEESFTRSRLGEQRLDLAPQCLVVRTRMREKRRALVRLQNQRGVIRARRCVATAPGSCVIFASVRDYRHQIVTTGPLSSWPGRNFIVAQPWAVRSNQVQALCGFNRTWCYSG